MQTVLVMVKSLTVMALLCAIAEFLLPAGNIKKSAMIGIGMLFVLSMALPVVNVLTGEEIGTAALWRETITEDAKTQITHEQWLEGIYSSAVTGGG